MPGFRCPHCTLSFRDEVEAINLLYQSRVVGVLLKRVCPECERVTLHILNHGATSYNDARQILPKANARPPCPTEVPTEFAEDYTEACLVLADSPKASAALSRRCLQHLLREKGQTKSRDLNDQIDEVINSGTLPTHLMQAIDAVRQLGNFAAHPIKSRSTGEIVPIEPGEAEWLLDTLEGLFDFYIVQPAVLQQKRHALNQKLQDAGKPPLK
jgi:hypothetical protein